MKRNTTTSTTHLPDAKKQKTTSTTNNHLTIGVLALQGAFREHVEHLKQMDNVAVCEIRNASELLGLDGLVIPGGESTAIAKIATRFGAASDDGLFARLQDWIATEQKPIWGTCAGLIFLANKIVGGEKTGGQPLIGGLDVEVSRNYFGKQIKSFEAEIEPPPTLSTLSCHDDDDDDDNVGQELDTAASTTYTGVFIRAPAILATGAGVRTLSSVVSTSGATVAVAVEQGHLLATAFHPELTEDARWHEYFVRKCRTVQQKAVE